MKLKLVLATLTASASVVTASTVANYTAGVAPTAGTTGAADPTTQGWAASPGVGASVWSNGLDSTIGGWRIIDGTSSQNAYYQHTISVGDASAMASNDWTSTWTVAYNADLLNASTSLDGWLTGANSTRQNDNAMWVEVAGQFRYIMSHTQDASGNLFINDGTTSHQITTAGSQLSEETGTGSPLANYVTFTLSYDQVTGIATLTDSFGGSRAVGTSGGGGSDRIIFGAYSSGGMGSTTWNAVNLDVVPEPSTAVLLGLGGLALLRRRR